MQRAVWLRALRLAADSLADGLDISAVRVLPTMPRMS